MRIPRNIYVYLSWISVLALTFTACGVEADGEGDGPPGSADLEAMQIEYCERMGECDETFDVQGCLEEDGFDEDPECPSEILDFHDCQMELSCEQLLDGGNVMNDCEDEIDAFLACEEESDNGDPPPECPDGEWLIELDGETVCLPECDSDDDCASPDECHEAHLGDSDVYGVCVPDGG